MSSPATPSQKRQCKCVSFKDETIQNPAPESTDEVPLEAKWYTKPELHVIRKEVGSILIRHINSSKQQVKEEDVNDDPELWGLERHSFERDQAKKAAIKLILLAQNMKEMKGDPELLRSVSLQVSKNARQLAADQGFRDACSVYYENFLETLVDDCIFDFDSFPLEIPSVSSGCKRTPTMANLPAAEDHLRRVRSRVVAA